MSAWQIAWRGLRTRAVETALAVAVLTMAVAMAVTAFALDRAVRSGVKRASAPFDMIVGARGSSTQLVTNTIFLRDVPVGNIPLAMYEQFRDDPRVDSAVPVGLGDNFRGFRIVGTTREYFALRERPSDPPFFTVQAGRVFAGPFEAVLGAGAAGRLDLRTGDRFTPAHGVEELITGADEHEGFDYVVVGILAATGTPADLGIYTAMESVWATHEGEEHGAEDGGDPESGREVTAVLVRPHGIRELMQLYQEVNSGDAAQAVFPGEVLVRLFELLGQGRQVTSALTLLILVMAACTMVLALMAAMAQRRREVALLRALGAGRRTVMAVVLCEAGLMGLLGGSAGLVLGLSASWLVGRSVAAQTGVPLRLSLAAADVAVVVGALALSLLGGLWPALAAYRVQAARYLAGES